jgi:hypothetical protein
VVQGYGLDLNLLRFDFDLSLAAVFMHPDGTVYGRYGSRDEKDAAEHNTLEGFTKAAAAALDLHAQVAKGKLKKALSGKRGWAGSHPVPERIPVIAAQFSGPAVNGKGCMHCHNIREGEVTAAWDARKPLKDADLWPFPMPELLGLFLEPSETAVVRSVEEGSPAAKAGFLAGDRILSLEGQPVVSIADLQWVLQFAPEPGKVSAEVARDGKTLTLPLPLKKGWRRQGDIEWRRSSQQICFNILGFRCTPLDAGERVRLGIAPEALALQVIRFPPGGAKAANQAAQRVLKQGDVIVAVDGLKEDWSEGDLLIHVSQGKKAGARVPVTVLRAGKPVQLQIPLQ